MVNMEIRRSEVSITELQGYDISPSFGFLSSRVPLTTLPLPIYQPWETLASGLPSLLAARELRSAIRALPIIPTANLSSKAELQRAFTLLSFLVHAYVWSNHENDLPEPRVPPSIAEPYLDICERLDMQPTLSYAGLCLWNWRRRGGAADDSLFLSDLDCLFSFTGTRDEAVFYLVPVLVEAEGGKLVKILIDAVNTSMVEGDSGTIIRALEQTKSTMVKMAALLRHLHQECDPEIFYHRVRPFFAGGKGMEDKGMPKGVLFERRDGSLVSTKCVGGSAAQSSLFQFIDLVLGVEHTALGGREDGTLFEVRTRTQVPWY